MTNSSPWFFDGPNRNRWFTELNSMVIFHGELLNNQMVYDLYNMKHPIWWCQICANPLPKHGFWGGEYEGEQISVMNCPNKLLRYQKMINDQIIILGVLLWFHHVSPAPTDINPLGCVWKCCVPHCTQWFCWSLSLWKMAISLGILTQHFQTFPDPLCITALLDQRECRLPLAPLGRDTDGCSEAWSSGGQCWAARSVKSVKNMIENNKCVYKNSTSIIYYNITYIIVMDIDGYWWIMMDKIVSQGCFHIPPWWSYRSRGSLLIARQDANFVKVLPADGAWSNPSCIFHHAGWTQDSLFIQNSRVLIMFPLKNLKKTHQSHVLNVLHPGTKQGNAYAIAIHCLRFAYLHTSFAYAHILSYVELTLAYAHHCFPTPHPSKGPLPEHEHKGLERGSAVWSLLGEPSQAIPSHPKPLMPSRLRAASQAEAVSISLKVAL